MTLPLLTWSQGPSYSAAGSRTPVQLMQLIKQAIDTDAGSWMVNASDFAGAFPYLELKLAGSPSGDLGTTRLLLFGGATPIAAAAEPVGTDTLNSLSLFAYLCVDPPGTVGNYTSVDPYAGATKQLKGKAAFAAVASSTSGNPYVYVIQSTEGIIIVMNQGAPAGCCVLIAGKLIEQNLTGLWCLGTTQTAYAAGVTTAASPSIIPGCQEAVNTSTMRALVGINVFTVGRIWNDLTGTLVGLANSALGFNLRTIEMAGRPRGAGVYEFFGVMRQIRYGASVTDRAKIYSGATLQAYGFGPNVAAGVSPSFFADVQA